MHPGGLGILSFLYVKVISNPSLSNSFNPDFGIRSRGESEFSLCTMIIVGQPLLRYWCETFPVVVGIPETEVSTITGVVDFSFDLQYIKTEKQATITSR